MAAAATAAMAATAATASRKLQHAALECGAVFLVEDIERRQADIRDFLFSEADLVTLRSVVHRRHIRGRPDGRCGCAPRE
jgi:hypothetical protein